ncbi:filament-like plant protein 7 [Magnolia sinica]|uniref:filament-like plant protein 7 n=1 Tax=Magnolia sinica TaxID=86752 RepID=UPI002658C622|nr:filament-like plant protein 7 [Magnolia sinica]XP_058081932.1 filament-like plant protein 7 [Magnolia sinica]XP_058081933.1 filament-like plant protein 7 [Magnolia sinica]XP_058081934.1 filament-like plant protein 7 [Magnolia sinica]
MEHKTWLWRKKSSEKTIVVNEKVNLSMKGGEQEAFMEDKALEMERSMKILNEKLSSALIECNAKDDLVTKHAKVAEEAIAGWEKAEAEAASFKEELEDALRQRVAAEERIVHLDAALKECMQQLRLVREEQEQKIHDAVTKTSREFEKLRINLEEKLAETSKKLSKLGVDNNHLSKVIQVKEKLVEDLSERKSQAEADFNALTARLDSMEKENASLKYEVHMLEKELEMRNEERDFNRKSADASHKQHLDSVKKIAKLETECQRLRLLVRKRLPGPAAFAKMRSEVECLGRDVAEPRKKKSNLSMGSLTVKDCMLDNCHDTSNKRISFLMERLCGTEEENKILKETLTKKNSELQSSRIMCARTASKLSQLEEQLGDLSKGQTGLELVRSMSGSYEPTLASISEDGYNEDEASCAESWASALISELEHFRNGKPKETSCRAVGGSDLSLMDDFVEMERLAIVAVDKHFESLHVSSDGNSTCLIQLETDSRVYPLEVTGKELVPIEKCHMGSSESNQEIKSKYQSIGKSPSWIQDIWRVILQQSQVAQRSLDEVLEEVRITLMNMNHHVPVEVMDTREISSHSSTSDPSKISGYISWKPPHTSPTADSSGGACDLNTSSLEIRNQQFCPNLNKSICKIIELIEGINQASSTDYSNQQFLSESAGSPTLCKESASYIVRVFQWKSSELSGVLRNFVYTCNDLLHGKADLERFAVELTSTLEWIMNHCFSLQDVSSMKDTIKKHFNWDESRSESELDVSINSPCSETEKVYASEECKRTNILSQMEKKIEFKLKEENRRLKDEIMNLEVGKKDLEEGLQSATNRNETLMTQLQESKQSIESLRIELVKLKESKGLIEDQIENHKLINEDLDTQLSVVRVELNEARQKFSSLHVELEDKNNCCEELEATCLELQLQLESVANKGISNYNVDQEDNQLRKEWEISAASEKLAECQETILNLGKQLKALASPRDAALIDKVIAPPASTKTNNRQSLLDQMLAEDDADVEEVKSPKTKEIICTGDPQKPVNPSAGLLYGRNISSVHNANYPVTTSFQASPVKSPRKFYGVETAGISLAIVPKRRSGGGSLWRKLLMRKKRDSSKKMPYALVA